MSRAGFGDDGDGDNWSMICWRGAVTSAIRGRAGQAFLREMLAAFDALPKPELIAGELEASGRPGTHPGQVCALGAVGKARGLEMGRIDSEDYHAIGRLFGIPTSLAREIMWENDECGPRRGGNWERFERMRRWVIANLKAEIR